MMISKPGDTILDIFDEDKTGAKKTEFYKYFLEYDINPEDIISSKIPISKKAAYVISLVTGVSEQFWLNRERDYRAKLAMLNEFNHIIDERVLKLRRLINDGERQFKIDELLQLKETINAD